MRTAIYARCSTDKQETAMQVSQLREYAKQREWDITGEYIDDGVSSRKAVRPQLNKLLSDAHKRRFDVVLFWKFDRMARSLHESLDLADKFNSFGVDLVSYTQKELDTTTRMGKAFFIISQLFAEMERDMIRERVIAGVNHARKHGTRSGKPIGRPGVKLDTAKVLQLHNEGLSIRQIAAELGSNHGNVHRILKLSQSDTEQTATGV